MKRDPLENAVSAIDSLIVVLCMLAGMLLLQEFGVINVSELL